MRKLCGALVLAFILTSQLHGANAPTLMVATSTQAAFQYNRPGGAVCIWEVSTDPSYSPLVAELQVPGAQIDSGTAGRRFFVLGPGAALAPGALHYWRQTCGVEVYVGQFTTLSEPISSDNVLAVFTGGYPFANKLKVYWGATPALGSSTIVDCAPRCSATITYPSDSVAFMKYEYLNEADVVVTDVLQVTASR